MASYHLIFTFHFTILFHHVCFIENHTRTIITLKLKYLHALLLPPGSVEQYTGYVVIPQYWFTAIP